jgi:hypothetical protein
MKKESKSYSEGVLSVVEHVDLLGSRIGQIKSLTGFKKGVHQLPDQVGTAAQNFVTNLAIADLETEAMRIFQSIKSIFRYKRKEIEMKIEGAVAFIPCRDFDLVISYRQNEREAKEYVLEYLLTNVSDLNAILHPELQDLLRNHFNEIRFLLSEDLVITDLIDELEKKEPENIDLVYSPDCNELVVTHKHSFWIITFKPRQFSIANQAPTSPARMMELMDEIRACVEDSESMRALLGLWSTGE